MAMKNGCSANSTTRISPSASDPTAHSAGCQLAGEFWIHAELAIILLDEVQLTVGLRGARTGAQRDRQAASDEGTFELGDEQKGRVRVVLGVLGVGKTEHVSGIFQNHMLEASAGTQQRPARFAGPANRRQCTGHAAIGAAWRDPQAIGRFEPAATGWRLHVIRSKPTRLQLDVEGRSRVRQGLFGSLMRRKCRITVADDHDRCNCARSGACRGRILDGRSPE